MNFTNMARIFNIFFWTFVITVLASPDPKPNPKAKAAPRPKPQFPGRFRISTDSISDFYLPKGLGTGVYSEDSG